MGAVPQGLKRVSENSPFKLQSRRACPELVERGRLSFRAVRISGTAGSVALILLDKPALGAACRNQVGGSEAGSSGSHGCEVLYQGTTLVGPLRFSKNLGFSPWDFSLPDGLSSAVPAGLEFGRGFSHTL